MLKKKQILTLLDIYGLTPYRDYFIILIGAALVLHGLKEETHDIDIAIHPH